MLTEPAAAGSKVGRQCGGGACWLLLASIIGKTLQDRNKLAKRSRRFGNREERNGESPVIKDFGEMKGFTLSMKGKDRSVGNDKDLLKSSLG